MGDFPSVVKYLDYRRASRDTTVNTKPLTLTRSREIKKVYISINVPAFSLQVDHEVMKKRLVAQFNYSVPRGFHIRFPETAPYSGSGQTPIVCVKFRFGTTVARYILYEDYRYISARTILVPKYTGDVYIQQNFVLEYWKRSITVNPFVVMPEWNLPTNLYENPTSPEQTETIWTDRGTLQQAALFHAFPEPLPTEYGEESAWIDGN